MKNALKVFALVLTLVACSDFFPEKNSGGGGTPPVQPKKPLPEKAVNDEKACAYGEISGDSKQTFLWNMATKNVCPKVREFRYSLTMLRLSAQQLCVDDGNPRVERDLEYQWFGVVSPFEYLIANPMEPMRADNQRLTKEIYAWPDANKFSLNAELLKAVEQDSAYTMNLAPSRKGLTAVEKLIFNKEAKLAPGATGRLRPEEEAFNNLPREKRRRARCVVLNTMLDDVASYTEELYAEWDAGQKQYPRRMLERLKAGGSQMVLNEVSDGLFYLEKVKDFKLGLPLGMNARCRKDKCPEEIEHYASNASIEALRANYESFRVGLTGFLGLVAEVGRPDLAASMTAIMDQMDLALKDVEAAGDFKTQVISADKAVCADGNSPVAICRLHALYKQFSTIYRSEFMTTLNLNPPRTEADND